MEEYIDWEDFAAEETFSDDDEWEDPRIHKDDGGPSHAGVQMGGDVLHSHENDDSGIHERNGQRQYSQVDEELDTNNGLNTAAHGRDILQWQQAMSNIGLNKLADELRREDIMGRVWSSLQAATDFYYLYAKLLGFSVRKGHVKRWQNGEIRLREWLCSREGKRDGKYVNKVDRQREARGITRVGCKATFRVTQQRNGNWCAKEFVIHHSHELAHESHTQFLRSNRNVSRGTLHTAMSMRSAGIRTCNIMSYMADQAGGYENMTHTLKDLHNQLASSEHMNLTDTDASRAIGYLEHKADHDGSFFCKYSYDKQFRLHNVFWADGRCQADYLAFGHAVAFDTTYKTNGYGKPLLVWVGVNHHFRTVIFGFAILVNETTETYKWVTKAFLECMKGRQPKTVVTNGDNAIKATISELMPDAIHRLCSWHIHQNGLRNIRDPDFHPRLSSLIYRYYSVDEFEMEWKKLVEDFGLQENEWMAMLYERRTSWAETYVRGNFFAGMCTTQRNEGINAVIKKRLSKKMKLGQFVRNLDRTFASLRHTEGKDDFETLNTRPLVKGANLVEIESHAAEVFTRAMFYRVREEIRKEGRYLVMGTMTTDATTIFHYRKYNASTIRRSVTYNHNTDSYICDCLQFPSSGIPCRHIFATMKIMGKTSLPESLIWDQWTMRPRGNLDEKSSFQRSSNYTYSEESTRFGHICSQATELAYFASKSPSLFTTVVDALTTTYTAVKKMWEVSGEFDTAAPHMNHQGLPLRNPLPTKSKGTSKMKKSGGHGGRKCSQCKMQGHNKTTCNRRKGPHNNAHQSSESNDSSEEEEINLCDAAEEDTFFSWNDDLGTDLEDQLTMESNSETSSAPADSTQWWGTPYGYI